MSISGPEPRVVVVGAGLAGLMTALKLAPHPVLLLTPTPLGEGSASAWAQGGVAAALGEATRLNNTQRTLLPQAQAW